MQSPTPRDANSPYTSLSREQNFYQLLSEITFKYYPITINCYPVTVHDCPMNIRCSAERFAILSPSPPPCIGSSINFNCYPKFYRLSSNYYHLLSNHCPFLTSRCHLLYNHYPLLSNYYPIQSFTPHVTYPPPHPCSEAKVTFNYYPMTVNYNPIHIS